MEEKKRFKYWHKFALMMYLIVLAQLTIISFAVGIMYAHGLFSRFHPILILVLSAAVISFIVIFVISNLFINPIDEISEAMRRVSIGDFTIQMEEKGRFRNIEMMNINFNKMVKGLNSTEMLKSDFITNVSHEFKTPLAAIEGYTSLLNATELNEEQRMYAASIMESASRLTDLTGNILRLSKLENQQFDLEKTEFELDEQLRQTILLLEPQWTEKSLNIEPELDSIHFCGYEELLDHVWINLISNAIKFTPKGGTLSFETKETASEVIVSVSDSGIGMSEEEQAHVFDKFYQAEHNHSVSGNGLGLTLVKQIVQMHNGSIKVKSAPDEGSTFTVYLPKE